MMMMGEDDDEDAMIRCLGKVEFTVRPCLGRRRPRAPQTPPVKHIRTCSLTHAKSRPHILVTRITAHPGILVKIVTTAHAVLLYTGMRLKFHQKSGSSEFSGISDFHHSYILLK